MKVVHQLIIAGIALMACALPAQAETFESSPIAVEAQQPEIKIYVKGQTVRIVGAAKKSLQVFNLTGTQVAPHTIEADDQSITLDLPKGIYALKVGNVARKITL